MLTLTYNWVLQRMLESSILYIIYLIFTTQKLSYV